uniref:Uncharacterized protein n=1 Tax=Marmota marmota marmota TaxID=9994 RepID=A0A8C6EQX7_MARMA
LMADQQISQSGQSPSLPSTSETHLEVVDDSPGIFDSAPWVESGLLPETTGLKRKRESSTESEDELEDLESELNHPWDVESLCGHKIKLKKRRMDSVQPEHHEVFKRLLGRETPGSALQSFLDTNKELPYLLSMVIAYFSRAGLFSWQYQRIHFFLALFKLMIRSSGCGAEIAPSLPRSPGTMLA